MKITKYYRALIFIFCLFTGIKTIEAQCSASFTYSIGTNGYVVFFSTASPINSTNYYNWTFGNGAVSQGTNVPTANTTYTSNGIYTVTLVFSSAVPSCDVTATQTISINNITPCSIVLSYTPATGNNCNGTASVVSVSGLCGPASFYWSNFNTGSFVDSLCQGTSYTVTASSLGSGTCCTSITQVFTLPSNCSLTAAFIYTLTSSSGVVNFTSTSTGTNSGTTYLWKYGDNSSAGFGSVSSHTYATLGTYTVQLLANNNFTASSCVDSTFLSIQVGPAPCNLTASFTHTVGASGAVSFSSNSTGANIYTKYSWDFGDGVYGLGNAPAHTYQYGGAYNVKLIARDSFNLACADTIVYSVNVTGLPCTANSGFNVAPSGTPQYWLATPFFPWNVTNASWTWGDGTTSNTLYTSHTYSVAGSYNICLSVTVSCGATNTTCSTHAIFKASGTQQDMQMLYINVVKPALIDAIASTEQEISNYQIFPNPNSGEFNLVINGLKEGKVTINIYNIIGEMVYTENNETGSSLVKTIELNNMPNGVYFLNIKSGDKTLTKKIIVQKQ